MNCGLLTVMVIASTIVASPPAAGQERPAPAVEVAAGTHLFPDDGTVSEDFLGGTARFYLSPRVSVGPEVAFINGENHRHLMFTGNLTFDFVASSGTPQPSVIPFVVVGAGLFRTREEFVQGDPFTSTEGAFTAGGGFRAQIGKRFTLGAEARVGWETHVRLNATFGVRLGN